MSVQETSMPTRTAPPAADSALAPSPAPLALVEELCTGLSAAGVDYCHWKSNEAIERSASGDNDLDLLVRREHVGRFTELVHALGFKQARQAHTKEFPGVLHFIGVDRATERFVDIHAHYQLVVGDDMTKNHRLPIERAYLASSRQGPVFRVPAPELELATLVIRLVLKHATWDAKLTLQGSLAASERREVGYLEACTDWDAVAGVVAEHLPLIDRRLWDRCVGWVLREGPGWDGVGVARDLSHALSAHTRAAWLPDMALKITRRGRLFARRRVLRRPSDRNRPEAGGAIIAVLGQDMVGRAKVVDSTAAWLSGVFRTTTVRFPDRRGGGTTAGRPPGEGRRGAATPVGVLHSWHRHRSYVRARRSSAGGRFVVCDGFPEWAPGPGTGTADPGARPGPLTALRDHYDRQLLAPDLLIVLHSGSGAHARSAPAAPGPTDARAPVVLVDTRQPAERVLSEVRRAIWTRL